MTDPLHVNMRWHKVTCHECGIEVRCQCEDAGAEHMCQDCEERMGDDDTA